MIKIVIISLIFISLLLLAINNIRFLIKKHNLKKNACKGIAEYEFLYGISFLDTPFFMRKNYESAIYWLTKSGEQNYLEAIIKLAEIYLLEDNENIFDYNKAAYWLEKSSNLNHMESTYKLALLYGLDTSPILDYKKSADYMKKAANMGHCDAQFTLGLMYSEGIGIEQNLVLACAWLSIAKINGVTSYDLDEVLGLMEQKDIEKAENFTQEYFYKKRLESNNTVL